MMKKYALIVRAGTSGGYGKYYNNCTDGSPLLFDDEKKAEKFALKVENGSSKNVWIEVVEYDSNRKLPEMFQSDFIQTYGSKLGKTIEDK